jgi:uncharacterized protein (DUF2164 family)
MDFPEVTEFNSSYYDHAGRSPAWLDTDTKTLYKTHIDDTEKRKMLEELGWDKNNPTYEINSNGFRSPEFKKDEPNIVFLGCSHTVGVGINLSDTFSHHVSQSLGLQNYNLGKGGGSNQTAFRLGHYWIPKLKPKIVVLLSPDRSRTEIILGGKAINISVHTRHTESVFWPYVKAYLGEEENLRLNALAHRIALEKISTDVGARFIGLEYPHDLITADQWRGLDLARDLSHLGPIAHELTARHILAKIKI